MTKTGGMSQIDSIESQNNEAIKVVGSFDELNGVLTPDQCNQIKSASGKKVKLVSLEEVAHARQVEKEALLAEMPEDAYIIEG